MYLSPETVLFIREHRNDDIRSLALQAKKYPQVDMSSAIVQIAGWQAAASKYQVGMLRKIFFIHVIYHWNNVHRKSPHSTKPHWHREKRWSILRADSVLIVLFSQPGLKQSPTSNAKKNFARLPLTIFHYWD